MFFDNNQKGKKGNKRIQKGRGEKKKHPIYEVLGYKKIFKETGKTPIPVTLNQRAIGSSPMWSTNRNDKTFLLGKSFLFDF